MSVTSHWSHRGSEPKIHFLNLWSCLTTLTKRISWIPIDSRYHRILSLTNLLCWLAVKSTITLHHTLQYPREFINCSIPLVSRKKLLSIKAGVLAKLEIKGEDDTARELMWECALLAPRYHRGYEREDTALCEAATQQRITALWTEPALMAPFLSTYYKHDMHLVSGVCVLSVGPLVTQRECSRAELRLFLCETIRKRCVISDLFLCSCWHHSLSSFLQLTEPPLSGWAKEEGPTLMVRLLTAVDKSYSTAYTSRDWLVLTGEEETPQTCFISVDFFLQNSV